MRAFNKAMSQLKPYIKLYYGSYLVYFPPNVNALYGNYKELYIIFTNIIKTLLCNLVKRKNEIYISFFRFNSID